MKTIIIKECYKHGETEFVLDGKNHFKCLKCRNEAVQKRREVVKQKAVEYKGGKCEICGYDKCIDALEFHHINPEEKDFGISKKGYTRSWEKVKEEVDKCMLLCANCHREIHSLYKLEMKNARLNGFKDNISLFNEKNLTNKTLDSKVSQIKRDDLLQDISNGLTIKSIATKYDISVSYLRKIFKKFSIKLSNPVKKLITLESLIKDFMELKSFTNVGKKYGVSDKAVTKWCKSFGLPYKKKDLMDYLIKLGN